mgnify:CR=1 FL=1
MNHKQITEKYYSKWIGQENILESESYGVKFLYSRERNNTQYGYSKPFDLYIFIQDSRIIFSYFPFYAAWNPGSSYGYEEIPALPPGARLCR